MGMPLSETDEDLRRVVARVALLNLAYFGVEFSVALAIGSVSLFADSIDFLEDTSVNFLILIALGLERSSPHACGHGARWHPAHSGASDALDGLG
jgi:Co/Zn/Cd efflux system component